MGRNRLRISPSNTDQARLASDVPLLQLFFSWMNCCGRDKKQQIKIIRLVLKYRRSSTVYIVQAKILNYLTILRKSTFTTNHLA